MRPATASHSVALRVEFYRWREKKWAILIFRCPEHKASESWLRICVDGAHNDRF